MIYDDINRNFKSIHFDFYRSVERWLRMMSIEQQWPVSNGVITIELLTHATHFSQIYARSDIFSFRNHWMRCGNGGGATHNTYANSTGVNINMLTEPVHYLSTGNVLLIAQYTDVKHTHINHSRYFWMWRTSFFIKASTHISPHFIHIYFENFANQFERALLCALNFKAMKMILHKIPAVNAFSMSHA